MQVKEKSQAICTNQVATVTAPLPLKSDWCIGIWHMHVTVSSSMQYKTMLDSLGFYQGQAAGGNDAGEDHAQIEGRGSICS
jgi:hypothetical protein